MIIATGSRRKAGKSPSVATKRVKKSVDLGWTADDDEIESEDEFFQDKDVASESEEEEEAVDAKRVRLARQYLEKIEAGESSGSSSSEDDDDEDLSARDRVGRKLQRDRLKKEGTLERAVADRVEQDVASMHHDIEVQTKTQPPSTEVDIQAEAKAWVDSGNVKYLRGHDLTVTCVALQANGERALSGSKDNSVMLWDVENCKRITNVCEQWKTTKMDEPRGNGEALAVACSYDGRYVAVGRRDATVNIFDIRLSGKKQNNGLVTSFRGHKGPVTSLAFRSQSLQLFSGSQDRCIRHYNLEEMSYIETLYGHQAGVTGIDCHRRERPVSVAMDRTARAWKLAEDTHLIFRGGSKISWADCVSVIKDDWFVTGHNDGNLCLWMADKKKAVATFELSHGQVGANGRGVYSIGGLKGSDMVVSGSNDGYLRLWKVSTGSTVAERGIKQLMQQVPVYGFVNGIAVGPKARFCAVATGQEPRLGRWDRVPRAKNRFGIVKLRLDDGEDESEEDPVEPQALVDEEATSSYESSNDDDSE